MAPIFAKGGGKLKVILSRKGFDSSNGGCPSPIMPDGTLISMPIPSKDGVQYSDLQYNGISYAKLLSQLNSKAVCSSCHLDPDIRDNVRTSPISGWKAAFGQANAAQGILTNAKVEKGDIFLFFGWFRQTELKNGVYKFTRKQSSNFYRHSDLQIIYGYMEIGEIIKSPAQISKYPWHPHASENLINNKTNALYIPSDRLSLNPELPGYGTLDFRTDRVLTLKGQKRATWIAYPFLTPEHVYGNKKNSAKGEGLYYAGIWQELVINESEGLIDWVCDILSNKL